MPTIYDYVVKMRVTRPGQDPEEHVVPIQAYNAMEAATCVLFELDAEGALGKDATAKVLSVRPDAARVAAETQALAEQALASAEKFMAKVIRTKPKG